MADKSDIKTELGWFPNVVIGALSAGLITVIGLVGIEIPNMIRCTKLYHEQTSKDKIILEKYAPQVKNGEPLTIQQGIELIIKEHDNNKNGKISIMEAMDVLDRVKRYENRNYKVWNESSKNLYKSLLEIDEKQTNP